MAAGSRRQGAAGANERQGRCGEGRPEGDCGCDAAALVVLAWIDLAAAAAASGGVYVSLGDSYTAAPLVPNQHGKPIDCARSDHNYPSLVAAGARRREHIDVSCSSAETKHMTEPQTGLPLGGTNPPQFDAAPRRRRRS